jgi:hypothetical protein
MLNSPVSSPCFSNFLPSDCHCTVQRCKTLPKQITQAVC